MLIVIPPGYFSYHYIIHIWAITSLYLFNSIQLLYIKGPNPSSSVGSDAGCQSRGCEFEPQLGQHSFLRLTKVIVISVNRLLPMAMWKSSKLLGKNVVWLEYWWKKVKKHTITSKWTGRRDTTEKLFKNVVKPQSINQIIYRELLIFHLCSEVVIHKLNPKG